MTLSIFSLDSQYLQDTSVPTNSPLTTPANGLFSVMGREIVTSVSKKGNINATLSITLSVTIFKMSSIIFGLNADTR